MPYSDCLKQIFPCLFDQKKIRYNLVKNKIYKQNDGFVEIKLD